MNSKMRLDYIYNSHAHTLIQLYVWIQMHVGTYATGCGYV